jgi:hypothetical protein
MKRTLEEIRDDGHQPTYRRRRAGMTALRPARVLYATTVTCECGWELRGGAGNGKRWAEQHHHDHLRFVDREARS